LFNRNKQGFLATYSAFYNDIEALRRQVGGGDSGFSAFKGALLEEAALRIAESVVAERQLDRAIVTQPATSSGVVTGISLKYRRGKLADPVEIAIRRDRDDVIVGFQRDLVLHHGGERLFLRDELVPVCTIACKAYVDATRLENLLAKARSMAAQYASASFLVFAETDELGQHFHDEDGQLLDSLYAPIDEIILLREGSRRQQSPVRPAQVDRLRERIARSLQGW
jgi:hypothetical protein